MLGQRDKIRITGVMQLVQVPHCPPQTGVTDREDIQPFKTRNKKHFTGPPTNTAQLG